MILEVTSGLAKDKTGSWAGFRAGGNRIWAKAGRCVGKNSTALSPFKLGGIGQGAGHVTVLPRG